MTERTARVQVLAGVTAVATLGAVAAGGVVRNVLRRKAISHDLGEFAESYNSRTSIVIADDGVPLHVCEMGEPDAVLTVIFVHGFCLDMRTWFFQRDLGATAQAPPRLVFFDQRGHGRSGQPAASSCTITQLGADLAAVVRAVASGPVVVVGHSMGGMAIMALAQQQPQLFERAGTGARIVGIGFVSTSAANITSSALGSALTNPLADALREAVRRAAGAVEAGRGLLRRVVAPVLLAGAFGSRDVSPAVRSLVVQMLEATPITTIANFLPALEHHDERAALPAVATVPSVVVVGYEDKVTLVPQSIELYAALSESKLCGVPDAGHAVVLEAPGLVNEALEELLTRAAW